MQSKWLGTTRIFRPAIIRLQAGIAVPPKGKPCYPLETHYALPYYRTM